MIVGLKIIVWSIDSILDVLQYFVFVCVIATTTKIAAGCFAVKFMKSWFQTCVIRQFDLKL